MLRDTIPKHYRAEFILDQPKVTTILYERAVELESLIVQKYIRHTKYRAYRKLQLFILVFFRLNAIHTVQYILAVEENKYSKGGGE
jgi:hypothetical protein